MRSLVIILFLACLFVRENATAQGAAPSKKITIEGEATVYGIAYQFGIPTRALIAANNLRPPYVLTEGQVLVIPSPGEHIVGQGETLQSIAEDYSVKVDVLAHENNISSPFFVHEGDILMIPSRDTDSFGEAMQPATTGEITTTALAPLPLIKSAPPPAQASGTPSSLAPLPAETSSGPLAAESPADEKRAALLPDDLAAELAQEKEANTGKKASSDASSKSPIMGNLADGNKGAPPPPPALASEDEDEKPKKAAKKETSQKVVEKETTKKSAEKESSKELAKQSSLFTWPVQGKVIGKFASGGKNDGINIKVPEGTSVKASASGEVMYAGSELKGFGNLLLIKHKDGWMTAYAHNSELLVKKGDKVKQGQAIAKSGKNDANVPQLHFEIRKGKQPIDPLPKLES
jgi:murein DD-endopeptidase MepM/ murein hydrolase activator NlpD